MTHSVHREDDPVFGVLADAREAYGAEGLPEQVEAAARFIRKGAGRWPDDRGDHRHPIQRARAAQAASERLDTLAAESRSQASIRAAGAQAWVVRLWRAECDRLVDQRLRLAATDRPERRHNSWTEAVG